MWWEHEQVYALATTFALWLSCVIYLAPLRHRSHVHLRALAALAVKLVLTAAVTALCHWKAWPAVLVGYGFALLFFLFCGEMGLPAALYCGVWALLTQQLAEELFFTVRQFTLPLVGPQPALWLTAAVGIFGVCYYGMGMTVARWMPTGRRYIVGPRQLSLALLLLAIFELLFYLVTQNQIGTHPLYPIILLLAQVYCITMLYLQNTLFTKSAMRQELAILNQLWYEQKEQYQLAKETIAIINRKCHDLKHQLAAMRTMFDEDRQEKYLREIEDSVRIYDSMVKTGNEVLDTVLTEKSLHCGANGIQVNCVADGHQLGFMDPVDLYTVLGNALDNAVESVQGIREPERRTIDVLVCTQQKFLVLQVVNPLQQALSFDAEGLPLSTKPHDGYHGFGLKSIRHTVQKYGGFTTVTAEDGHFALKILIPLP